MKIIFAIIFAFFGMTCFYYFFSDQIIAITLILFGNYLIAKKLMDFYYYMHNKLFNKKENMEEVFR